MKVHIVRTAALVVTILFFVGSIAFASNSSVSITSPNNGSNFFQGATLAVTVTAPSDATRVAIFSDGIGAGVSTEAPYNVSLVIPAGATGAHTLTAVAADSIGNLTFSEPITVVISPPSTSEVTSIATIPSVGFSFVGEQYPFHIDATFSNGNTLNVTQVPGVIFKSQNTAIASVNPSGIVTAIGPGKTYINITYSGVSTSVSVSVPKSIRGDLTGHGIVDLDDLAVIQAALNTPAVLNPATGKDIDARDLNGDGVINIEDARILTTLCTYPRCASHP